MDPVLDICVKELIMDPVLDVCVREPIMDPVLDVCVREPIMDPVLDVRGPIMFFFLFPLFSFPLSSTLNRNTRTRPLMFV